MPPRDGPAAGRPERRTAGALVFDGIPEVPPDLPRRIAPFLEARSSTLLDLAGDAVLIGLRAGEVSQVHLVERPGAEPIQCTTGSDPARFARFVPGAPGHILYAADRSGDERVQIYRLDRSTGQVVRLTDGGSRNIAHVLSADGRRLAWASNARNGRDFDIWLSDGARARSARLVLEREGNWSPVAFSRDGRKLLLSRYLSIDESELALLDVATGRAVPVDPGGPKTAHRAAVLSADGRRAYVAADRATEFTTAFEIDLVSGRFRPLGPSLAWNVEGLALSADERTLALVINQDGLSRLYLVDTSSRRWRRVPGIPDGVIGDLRAAASGERFGFTVDTATRPSQAWTLDAGSLRATPWTTGPGVVHDRRPVEPIVIRHPTFDGRRIPALYYRPAGRGPFPVLIDIHGGPEGQSRPVYDGLVQYLASAAGWAVLQPNVRGSSGYGKTYLGLDNGRRREDAVKDIGALLDWAERQPELDRGRMAVMGASYGGYMVLASLVHHGDRLAGGIELAGSSSFLSLLESVPDELRDIRRREVGDERDPAMRAFLHQASPLTHAGRIRDPIFVAQGLNDRRVPPRESEQIVRAVRRNRVPVWYLTAADEGHGFARKRNRELFLVLAVLFLDTLVR